MNLLAFNRVLRVTLLMPVILLGLLAGVLVWQIQEAVGAQIRAAQADALIQQLYQLQSGIIDEETGLRGYQLTGDTRMLEPFGRAHRTRESEFQKLSILLTSPAQQLRLRQLQDDYLLWEGYAVPASTAGRQAASDQAVLEDLQAKNGMDQMRIQMQELIREEQQSRDHLVQVAHTRVHDFLRIVLAAGLAVGVLIGTFTSSRLRRVSRAYEETLLQLKVRADELLESRQSYLTTLQSIGEGVIACDTRNRVRFMNAIAQQLTGWSKDEAVGEPLSRVFNAVQERTREPLGDLTRESPAANLSEGPSKQNHSGFNPSTAMDEDDRSSAHEQTAILLAKDGREIVIAHSAAPIRDASARALGTVVVFRDITEGRKAEQALIASEKVAITGRLAASIAHEIHNPLDSVATLHYLLKTEQDQGKRDEYLALAQQELSRTLQISRAMLSLYRESQQPVEVHLPELIDSVLLLLDRRIKDAQILVERRYASPGIITAYPGEIRQVATNVLANAIEAAGRHGRICVTIQDFSTQDDESATVLDVEDTGPGVDPAIRGRLFQPFVTSKGEKGTGLGLWVSRGIVQKHGGAMEIGNSVSRRLGGASVRVILPEKFGGGISAPAVAAPIVETPS